MIEPRLLGYPTSVRAELMVNYLAELDRVGAQGTVDLEQLFTADGPAPADQERTLSEPIPLRTRVLVTACAEITLATGDRIIHRLLVIPERRVWHMARTIPAPNATDCQDRVSVTQLNHNALAIILGIASLGDSLTRSFCHTTGVG